MKLLFAVLIVALSGRVISQDYDVAKMTVNDTARESLKVPLNGVVHVVLPSGQSALIQFTKLAGASAEYRWKYRRSSEAQVQAGTGRVVEKYLENPAADGSSTQVKPLPGHNVVVRAGEILAEWSKGSDGYCYFYFSPSRAQATLLDANAFQVDP